MKFDLNPIIKNNTKLNIFFDLEGVLIDDWYNLGILHNNIPKLKDIIEELSFNFDLEPVFHIFSHAISDDNDLNLFKEQEQPWIEEEFGHIQTIFVANNENLFALSDLKGIKRILGDMPSDLFGNIKSESFEQLVKRDFKSQINVLIDDTVEDSIKVFKSKNHNVADTTIIEILFP